MVVLAGCGGGDEPAEPTPAPIGAPPATATPSPTAEPTEEPAPSATPTPVEDQPGGAGDEEAPRVPVDVVVRATGPEPPQVAVPAFFPLEVTIADRTGAGLSATLGELRIEVPAGGRGEGRHPGLRPGEHELALGGGRSVTIVAGAEAGP